jgi:hypothetical protein
VKTFTDLWEEPAPTVVAYAEGKMDNVDVASLLAEMNRGGQGRVAEVDYKPPSCMLPRIHCSNSYNFFPSISVAYLVHLLIVSHRSLLGDSRYLSHVCLGLSSYRCCLEVPRELF